MSGRPDTKAGEPILPPDIYAGLVETLFGTVGSFVSGLFGGCLVPLIAWFRTGDEVMFKATIVTLLLTLFRLAVFFAHHRASVTSRQVHARRWEAAYAIGGVGFMTAVGLTAGILLYNHHDELTALYGIVITLGCAGSIAGRNAGRPKIVMGQVIGVCGPIAIILLLKYDAWFWGLSFIMILIVSSVRSTTSFLNKMLVTALLSERESQHQRLLLSTALNSMTHGLCMLSEDRTVTVMNQRLRDFFALSAERPVETLADLTAAIARHGALEPAPAHAFMKLVAANIAAHKPRTCTQALGSQIFLFRCEPMESGSSVMVVEDVTDARRSAEQVERLAHFDTLTGLANRFQFHRHLEAELAQLEQGRGSVALLSIDLDRFKEVNDTLGHQTGDKLLKNVAARLLHHAGHSHVVARFGGDEFQVMIRPSPGECELDRLAAELVSVISRPYQIDGNAISVGASIGIAVAPRDADNCDDLLKCADMALYSAKGASRGTYKHFALELDLRAQRKRRTEQELRDALAEGQLEVFYQPAVDVRTMSARTFEALVRWRHPLRGLVSPDDFIPVAEETGLIAEIGDFVLRRACEDARSWPEHIRVAVNVSAKQFLLRRDLAQQIVAYLAEINLPADRLEIEITESMLLDAREPLSYLVQHGVRVSLDDFGTGYSSLSYLRQFTVHKIKIDRSFIRDQDKISLAIIDAVASLAEALEVELVVEGVESHAQLDVLVARGITLIQGYLFSRPAPLGDIAPYLQGPLAPHEAVPLRDVA